MTRRVTRQTLNAVPTGAAHDHEAAADVVAFVLPEGECSLLVDPRHSGRIH